MVRAEHAVRLQDLDRTIGGFDVAWATHALYAIPPDEIGAGVARMTEALRPGGFGAIVHATTGSHYLRFAEAFRATFAPEVTPFTSAEQVTDALRAAGVTPSSTTLRYTVGYRRPRRPRGLPPALRLRRLRRPRDDGGAGAARRVPRLLS